MNPSLNNRETPAALTILLGILIALSALGTDMYVPALPDVAEAFDAPVSAAQLTLTTYFLGIAAGQLVCGPLSDRFGRRPVLLGALSTALAVTAAAPFLGSIAALSAARMVQGLCMGGGVVVARSVVRDLFAHDQAAHLISRMMIVFGIVPIAAPVLGAAIVAHEGWRGIFWAYVAIALVLLCAVGFGLRETAHGARGSLHPLDIARTLRSILSERRFVAPFLVFLCAQIAILAWVTNSAFTLVRGLGVPVVAYGWMFAAVMAGQIVGAWTSSRLVLRIGSARLLGAGGWLMFGGGAAGAALAWSGSLAWLGAVAPFCVVLLGASLIVPSATALALSPFPHAAGAASSLIGAIGFTVAAGVSTLLAAAFDGSARPMASVAALAGLGAIISERLRRRGAA
jgi:DHA1 family bicyclomycin/chloramphenicol resistance-like MFS transporter